MRVLILGGGTVGASVAEFLYKNGHQVTIVDSDPKVTRGLDTEMDIGVVTGSATLSSVLFQAGVMSADLCLALTGVEEVNMVSSSIAKAMGATRTAARVYAKVFQDLSTFDYSDHFKIDRLLSIEYLTAMELARRIREPGSMMIEHFARGELEMQEVVITRDSASTGVPLSELRLPAEVRIGSINREGKIAIASASDSILVGDRVTLLGARKEVEEVKKLFNTASVVRRTVTIAGGGETGYHLARALEARNYNVIVLEADRDRCSFLSEKLVKSTVIYGDARRRVTLEEERVGASDFFVAATGDDENNIMSCVEAKELGADMVLAVINRPDYAGVVGKLGIDERVSPREVMERQVEGLLHSGPLIFANPYLLSGNINVVELEVEKNAPVTQSELMNCRLPKRSLLASVVRDHFVQVPSASFRLKEGDSVVALVHESEIPELITAFSSDTTPSENK